MKSMLKKTDTVIQISYVTIFLGIVIWFFVSQLIYPSERNPADYFVTTYNDGWYYIDDSGERIPFDVPGTADLGEDNTARFEKILPADLPPDMWLCFKTSRHDVNVYIDGVLRHTYSTKDTRPFGLNSPSTYIFINVNDTDAGCTLTLEVSGDSAYSGVIRDVYYGDKLGIFYDILSRDFVLLVLACIILFLGLVSMIISFYIQHKLKTEVSLTYLSWCAVAIACWILSQSDIRHLFFSNISIIGAFEEFVLLLLPIPFAIYMDKLQKGRFNTAYLILELITIARFLITFLLYVTNKHESSLMDFNVYVLIVATLLIMMTTIIVDIHKKEIKEYSIAATGIGFMVILTFIQVLSATNEKKIITGDFLCAGFLILLIMATIQAVRDALISESQKKHALQASEAKAKFLASMSHEIRTPINAVLGIDEMIINESNEEKIRDYARDIQTAGRSLLAIINDILDFSKIESGKMDIVSMEYDLASVINDSCNMIRVKADEKKLIFHTLCDTQLPSRLLGDEVRIRQIFTNLLSNAVKYTHTGSITFSVTGHRDGNQFILEASVRDTGIGIKEENIPYLFDSFSRVDDSDTHKIEGSGLGLSIVHNLIELMKGELKVESVYGKGSTFTVTIPQKILSEVPIGTFAGDFSTEDLASQEDDFIAPEARVLSVDDVPMNLKVFCGLLKDTLINIDTVTSGKACLAKLRSNKYDIIFLDHMMPEMDGIETLRLIQAMDLPNRPPIIMLTANAILGAKEDYLNQGFTDYISKPIQRDKLLRMVKEYLPAELVLSKAQAAKQNGPVNLDNINFLNTEIGLSYHGGDKDFYLEIIKAYEEDPRLVPLQTYFEEQDWHNYRILVHSLSSSSKVIGAVDLSNLAKQLEDAAKASSTQYIKEHHTEMMAMYQSLLSDIRTYLLGDSEVEAATPKHSLSIVVVDDDKINLKTARKILKDHFEVYCFETGKEAVEFIKESIPDMVLLDIHMPEMNGFDVLNVLKNTANTKNIPVVFLTADTDAETELNGFKAGAMDYIRKPFIPDIMLERITRIIELDRVQHNLLDEVERSNTKVETLSLQAMTTLAKTIDAKDRYTKGHSTRVAEYSKQLAKYLGLSDEDQETIYFMGLLHDIGKIGVPDYIITKSQKLTNEEFAIIKKHTTTGYDILKNFGEIPNIEQGARWHHERMDGKGYPDGLRGDEIPLMVRIISVADAYDAMTSKRNYRNILPREFIREELVRCKGTQFDPQVVEALLQIMDEITSPVII